MLRRSGVDGLINQMLTGLASNLAVFVSGVTAGLSALLIVYLSPLNLPEGNKDYYIACCVGLFMTAAVITGGSVGLVMGMLESAVTALFVCYSDDPAIMRELDNEFHNKIVCSVAEANKKPGVPIVRTA